MTNVCKCGQHLANKEIMLGLDICQECLKYLEEDKKDFEQILNQKNR